MPTEDLKTRIERLHAAYTALHMIEDTPAAPAGEYRPLTAADKLRDFTAWLRFRASDRDAERTRLNGRIGATRAGIDSAPADLRALCDAAAALTDDDRALLRETAAVLYAALAPKGDAADGGYFQTKAIRRKKQDADGNTYIEEYHYLYFRYWATGGGADRQQRRNRNKYIGRKDLADALLAIHSRTPAATARDAPNHAAHAAARAAAQAALRAAYHAGTLDELTAADLLNVLGDFDISPNADSAGVVDTLDAPSANRLPYLTDEQKRILRGAARAIADGKRRFVQRDSAKHGRISELVALGYLAYEAQSGRRLYYRLTDEGAARANLEGA